MPVRLGSRHRATADSQRRGSHTDRDAVARASAGRHAAIGPNRPRDRRRHASRAPVLRPTDHRTPDRNRHARDQTPRHGRRVRRHAGELLHAPNRVPTQPRSAGHARQRPEPGRHRPLRTNAGLRRRERQRRPRPTDASLRLGVGVRLRKPLRTARALPSRSRPRQGAPRRGYGTAATGTSIAPRKPGRRQQPHEVGRAAPSLTRALARSRRRASRPPRGAPSAAPSRWCSCHRSRAAPR